MSSQHLTCANTLQFEQLKKQKAKKEKAQKNKAEKAEVAEDVDTQAGSVTDEATGQDAPQVETEDVKTEEPEHETASAGLTTEDPLVSAVVAATDDDEPPLSDAAAERPPLARELTESQQSRLRSESFKSGGETEYKKQAARIEQLEKDNERLEKELEERRHRLQSAEAQVEELREGQSEIAELRTKASKSDEGSKEAERLVRIYVHCVSSLLTKHYL